VSEYAGHSEAARARSHFADGRAPLLLYTERAHFYHRHRLRGIRVRSILTRLRHSVTRYYVHTHASGGQRDSGCDCSLANAPLLLRRFLHVPELSRTCCAPQDVVFYQLPVHAGFYAELVNAIGSSTVAAHATVATLFASEDAGAAAAECWSCVLQHSLQRSMLQMEVCLQHGWSGGTDGLFLLCCRGT
jgi:Utp25, U3 small nucleolar RNA-associated SSU processome protein 25